MGEESHVAVAGETPHVVVVGAGPVGLSVALGLARRGRRVRVLEKEASTAEHSRAPAIWPGTQSVLDQLGVLDRFLQRGIVHSRVALHDADRGGTLLELPIEDLEGVTAHPRLLIVPQSVTERLLLDAVREEETAEVVFSAEVLELEPSKGDAPGSADGAADRVANGVHVRYRVDGEPRTLRCAFAVGCDGADSVVRAAIGADFEGETYGIRAALADVALPGRDDLASPRVTTRGGMVVGIRIDAGLWRLIMPLRSDDPRTVDQRIDRACVQLFPEDRGLGSTGGRKPGTGRPPVVWKSEFRLHRRVASRFVRGRIVLAGDAAHLNSPVGGQGMNAGIQDAGRLIEALDRAVDDTAGRGVREGREFPALRDYEDERRRAVAEGVNPFTDLLTRLFLFREGRFVRVFFLTARLILGVPPIRRRVLERVAMVTNPEP